MNTAYLVLEDKTVFSGIIPEAQNNLLKYESVGEIVFNTSHSGYLEIATDPSYHNQIIVMTAPMQGNYGVDIQHSESKKIWIKGFITNAKLKI